MITIVEGADGVGKTEFAKRLAEMRGCEYRHAGAPTHDAWWKEYVLPLHYGQNVVLDRWHVGEMVWPRLFGRPSLFGTGRTATRRFSTCNRAISMLKAELVIVVRDRLGIAETLRERGEGDQLLTVLRGQRQFMDIALQMTHLETSIIHSDSLRGRWTQWSSIA